MDTKYALKRVNLGIRAFQRCKNKQNGDKIVYRITQEGLHSLFPLLKKRKVKITMNSFLYLTMNQNIKNSTIPQYLTDLKKLVADPELGYFILYVEEDAKVIEMCTLLKFVSSIYFMASEEMVKGLKIKYFDEFNEETVKVVTKTDESKEGLAVVVDK